MSLKKAIRPLVPPLLRDLLRRPKNVSLSFSGDYESWDAASRDAGGYAADEILERVVASTRKVVSGEARFERDSVAFHEIEYSWPLLAALLQVANERRSLRVIDFGGALGGTLRQNWTFLRRLEIPISWNVVEQEHFVAAGEKEFTTDILKFHRTIEEAGANGVDAALFCGSLCYVPNPRHFVDAVAAAGAKYLVMDRLPIVRRDGDRIAVQRVGEPIYKASYPIRFFSERRLIEDVLADWVTIERWGSNLQPGENIWEGLFLEKR